MREFDADAAARARFRLEAAQERFHSHFDGHGWGRLTPEPFIPTDDHTIRFTNSAVVSFKPYIRRAKSLEDPGASVVQGCVRAQNLRRTDAGVFHPERLLSFTMLGVIARPDRLGKLAEDFLDFFRAEGVADGMLHRVNSADTDLVDAVGDALALDLDSEPAPYYRWSFGDIDMTGRGSTFAPRHAEDGHRDIANLIGLEWRGDVSAYGFGMGLEALLACKDDAWWSGLVTPGAAALAPSNGNEARVVDLVSLLTELIAQGIEPDSRGAGHVSRQAVRQVLELADTVGVGADDLASWIAALSAEGVSVDEAAAYLRTGLATPAPDAFLTLDLSFDCPDAAREDWLGVALQEHLERHITDPQITLIDRYQGPSLQAGHVSNTYRLELLGPSEEELLAIVQSSTERLAAEGVTLRARQQPIRSRLRRR